GGGGDQGVDQHDGNEQSDHADHHVVEGFDVLGVAGFGLAGGGPVLDGLHVDGAGGYAGEDEHRHDGRGQLAGAGVHGQQGQVAGHADRADRAAEQRGDQAEQFGGQQRQADRGPD